jgi:hypothetical protein
MTTSVTSGSVPATARALHVTAAGRAAAAVIGRLRAGVPRSLTWAPSLVSLVPPAATLTASTPDLDLLEAVVGRVVSAAGDAPGAAESSTRARPTPAHGGEPGRGPAAAAATPADGRRPPHPRPAVPASSVPRPRLVDGVDRGVAGDDRDGRPLVPARLDGHRWTRALEGRPLVRAATSGFAATPSIAPTWAASAAPPPGLARAAAGAGPLAGVDVLAPPPSAEQGALPTAAGSHASGPAARPGAAAVVVGAPTTWPATAGSAAAGGIPPSGRAASGRAAAGLRDLVQRWAEPVPATTSPPVPERADPPARGTVTAPATSGAATAGGPVGSLPAGPVDLLELGDALDELLAQEADTHGLDGRVL